MIVLIVNASSKKMNDVPIAKNGTENKYKALTGPIIDVDTYIQMFQMTSLLLKPKRN